MIHYTAGGVATADLAAGVLLPGRVTLESSGDGVAEWRTTAQKRTAAQGSDFPWKTKSAYLQAPDSVNAVNAWAILKLLESPIAVSKLTSFGFQFKQSSGLEGPWPVLYIALEGTATGAEGGELGYCIIAGYSPDWSSKLAATYGDWVKYHMGDSTTIPDTSLAGVNCRAIFFDTNGVELGASAATTLSAIVALLTDGGAIPAGDDITLPPNKEAVVYRLDVQLGWTDGRSGEVNAAYVSGLELAGRIYDIGPAS